MHQHGSFERGNDGIVGYHRACVDRNCVIDCEYKLNPVAITQINRSGGVATVTTLGTMMETVLLATSGELQTRAVNNAILAFICYSPNN